MTDDIVKHLQDTAWCKHYNDGGNNPSGKLMEEAAAEILRLRTENSKLRAANEALQAELDKAKGIIAWHQ